MDIILTRSAGIRGQGYPAGARLTVADEDGKTLIQMGKAVAALPVPEPPVEQKPAEEIIPDPPVAPTVSTETPVEPEPAKESTPDPPKASQAKGTNKGKSRKG